MSYCTVNFQEFEVMDVNKDGNLDIVLRPTMNGGEPTELFMYSSYDKGIRLNDCIWINDGTGKFNPYDNITVGQKDGLDGAICNVNYYKMPLSKRNILNEYNLLAYKNPPVETKWIPNVMIDWNKLKKLFFLRMD